MTGRLRRGMWRAWRRGFSRWAATRFRLVTRSGRAHPRPSRPCWRRSATWCRKARWPGITTTRAGGLRVFDAAVGGLGGCPYAPGASGNVATEAVHDHVQAMGYETGLDREVLARAAQMARAMRSGG